jgi:membrane protein
MDDKDSRATQTREKAAQAPSPDAPEKPDEVSDIAKPTWKYVFRRAWLEFRKDNCTDLASGLTYHAALSMMPGLLAVVSLLGIFGQGRQTTEAITGFIRDHATPEVAGFLQGPIEQLASSNKAGLALVAGIVGALWAASGYVGAFGRAMNRLYEVGEGRPIWILRPVYLVVTVVLVVLVVVMLGILFLSGPVAATVADAIGLGSIGHTVWSIVKWPIVLVLAITLIAVLYYSTPNVKQPRFRWISVGSIVALVAMAIAGLAFAFYVANFSKYNATYGTIGSVIIVLLGLWIMNLALLLGAEVDAETERGRELQAGIRAAETIQLPPRDTRQVEKREEQTEALVDEARELHADAVRSGDGRVEDRRPSS